MRSVDLNMMYEEAFGLRESEKSSAKREGVFRTSMMSFGMRSVFGFGMRAIESPTMRSQQTSAEPLACSVRRAMPAGLPVVSSRLFGRTSALPRSLPSRSATSSAMRSVSRRVFQKYKYAHSPNQALQPTRMLVTFHAFAWPAPSTRVADL